ncbi:sigma-70 family RNA polymerase sigma factor [Desulfurobacterium atlanticum]|uniref:RNA polymerase, sigma 28 subunit, SigD/FliA/WhiG n=1 Tax=Desulfurobacterium atlanticum TaxID=240169 RepID=A0A238Z0D4_9BACT|nr:sigma-70 family RNA polymerase sigma factor [Desulfurobacterium atlanticum]SNR76361.1 RNA polymerase, sigma 28 subunit, SigD/FliA/WhiG [Desulfurobacterium atlanticum]
MYGKSRKELVVEHLPLVKKVANKIYRRIPEGIIDFDDLVNTGVIGLMKAIDNFDNSKANFSTYAYIRIRGEILDYLRTLDFMSRGAREKVKNGEVENLKAEIMYMVSIEELLFQGADKLTIADTLKSEEVSPEENVILKEMKFRLARALDNLSEREKLILQLLFVEELDLKSISKILNISVSRISQIKKRAMEKLYKILEKDV